MQDDIVTQDSHIFWEKNHNVSQILSELSLGIWELIAPSSTHRFSEM